MSNVVELNQYRRPAGPLPTGHLDPCQVIGDEERPAESIARASQQATSELTRVARDAGELAENATSARQACQEIAAAGRLLGDAIDRLRAMPAQIRDAALS
ncbi:hypothetical protein CKO28_06035 [Rhodovibrio sodomensis]|uniref:Uncharacterized protein n=1 Tax=Rhodovibrio sodomensis TaxID=1088 RepID=A0ABS1DAV4_9PROT|nr:hypothetical protein [Rhodovibrio sodomensis]MBK1667591.1 hypothetical protein [Rhodovibrio sodomensis]